MSVLHPTDPTLTAITPNTIPVSDSTIYSGLVYAIQGSGGFTTVKGFDTVHRLVETLISKYDVTGAVEVLLDVRTFNQKLNIWKDSSNIDISSVPVYYDSSNDTLLTDFVTLTAAEFISGINSAARVVSVGKCTTIYTDFAQYVASYFGLVGPTTTATPLGVATLFSSEYNFNPNGGVFDTAALYNIISSINPGPVFTDVSGAYIGSLTGSITINNITKLLRNAVDANPFGNRDPVAGTTAGDPSHRANYGVTDGFYANDLLFIPSDGITITLNLVIDSEGFPLPLNNMGPSFSSVTGATQNSAFAASLPGVPTPQITSTFTSTSNTTSALITRTLACPLLIRLQNLSTIDPDFSPSG